MNNMITIPLITVKGLEGLKALCTLNKITYTVKKVGDYYNVLIPKREYLIWGLDEQEFE
jgi:hypothetical protein